MAKRSPSEQLDVAVEALMANPDAPLPAVNPRLSALLRIAADLRDLPRADFKARLKADLTTPRAPTAHVAPERETIRSTPGKARPIPEGYHTATTCLVVRDAPRALEFYKQAFGATELMRHVDPSGHVVHAEIQIGDTRIAIADEAPDYNLSPQALGGSSTIMQLYVEDVDAFASRAVAAGAKVVFPISDWFYGDRTGRLADPFGHLWIVATHVEDVSPEEMSRRMETYAREQAEQKATAPAAQRSESSQTITPLLQVEGAAEFIEFLKQAFGAEELFRSTQADGRIKHAEVRIDDATVELADATDEYKANPTAIHLYVRNADDVYRRALGVGATSMNQPVDQPYGDREGSVKDPFGNHWYIATPLKKSSGPVEHIPEGLRSVTPYLHPHGAPQFIDFLKRAFGAEEMFRAQSEGTVHHAKIRIGNSMIEMGEAHGPYQPMATSLHLHVDDTDVAYERALAAGAHSVQQPTDRPWGQRSAGVSDQFGNVWWIAAPTSDVREKPTAAESIPAIYQSVTQHLTVQNAPKLLDFMQQAFGATEVMRVGDPTGHFHAEVKIGDSIVMMGNAGHGAPESSAWTYLYVNDVDAIYQRVLQLGATTIEAPVDLSYGDRRATVKDSFGNTWGIAAPIGAKSVRERFRTVTPYLGGRSAPQLIDFLKQTFGATELTRGGDPDGDDFHAEVTIGDSMLIVGGAPETSSQLYVYVDDVDATYQRALQAGATSRQAPTDQAYGDRNAFVNDPFGNIWYIATKQAVPEPHAESAPRSHGVMPFLYIRDAAAALAFYEKVFDATELMREVDASGIVSHAQFKAGDAQFMIRNPAVGLPVHYIERGLSRTARELGGTPVHLYLYVENVDKVFTRALAAGANVVDALGDKEWGDRCGGFQDPFGHIWYIATPMAKVPRSASEEDQQMAVKPIPEGSSPVTPYLCVKDAPTAIEFYKRAFGATESMRLQQPDGRIGHAEIKIAGGTVMLADEFPEMGILSPKSLGGARPPVSIHLYVADVDAVYKRAVHAGATSLREPADQFYGDRNAQLQDPSGHVWFISSHKEDVSPEELDKRFAALTKKG